MIENILKRSVTIFVCLLFIAARATAQFPSTRPGLAGTSQTPSSEQVTVEQAVQEALAQNLALRAELERIPAAQGQLRQAGLVPNPVLTSNITSDRVSANEGEGAWSASAEKELETAGKRRYRRLAAGSDLERVRYETDTFRRNLIAQTQKAYFALVQAGRDLSLARETSRILQRLVDLNAERVRVGDAPGLELNLARVELARSHRNEQDFERRDREATAGLNLLMGRPPASAVAPTSDFSAPIASPPEEQELLGYALENRPEILAADKNVEARAAAVGLAQSLGVPNVTWGVAYQQSRSVFSATPTSPYLSDVDRLLVVQATVPLPFFNRNQGNIASAEYERRSAKEAAQYARKVVENEIAVGLSNYRSRVGIRALYEGSVLPQLQRNVEVIQEAYRAGNESIFAVIQVQRTFFDTRREYLQTLLDLETNRIELERAIGRPLR